LSYLAVIDSSITKINTSKYYSFYYYDVIGKLVSTGNSAKTLFNHSSLSLPWFLYL
jgi:hypothetical protein